ncbi:MAG: hypothetical protein JW876_01860 [Candidatus Krumholzibacteriota bacterium]|nr:hypothetical protein [Candidatus Krumholzibacteriota bacterium]
MYTLLTVAKAEIRLLLRSWFFRILSLAALAILAFMSLGLFTGFWGQPWVFRGLGTTIPLINILYLNVVQAIVAVFLSADFLKRDRKLDTTEVVYMRSMPNVTYVAGKTLGILVVFALLDLVVLVMSAVFNIAFSGGPFVASAYIVYPLLVALPTIVFTLGFSFLLMTVVRNQPVTFVLLLGVIGISLFWLGPKQHGLFDLLGLHLPLVRSGIAGFADPFGLVLQRGVFLLLGLAGIAATSLRLRRLSQSRAATVASGVLALFFLAAAVAAAGMHDARFRRAAAAREAMRALTAELAGEPAPAVERCDLSLVHEGNRIDCEAAILLANDGDRPIERYLFTLNPGLEVRGVERGGREAAFTRDRHVLSVTPPAALPPGARDSLVVQYGGAIDDGACYLDTGEEGREPWFRIAMFVIGERHAWVTPSWVLLTPEAGWYPRAGMPYDPARPETRMAGFARYRLDVTTRPELLSVSQGAREKRGEGRWLFEPERPLDGLTLAIGRFEERAIEVDSLRYALCIREGNDWFDEYMDAVGDTLPELVREVRADYERLLGLSYPDRRYTIVEVPVTFVARERLWSMQRETIQPEIVLLPERGLLVQEADFNMFKRQMGRRRRGPAEELTPAEEQSRQFTRFAGRVLAGELSERGFMNDLYQNNRIFNAFPMYYTHVTHVGSGRWPVLDVALESWIAGRIEGEASPFTSFFGGLSSEEETNLELAKTSLADLVADPEKRAAAPDALRAKGRQLFLLLQRHAGEEAFAALVDEAIEAGRFGGIDADLLSDEMEGRFGIDLAATIDRWYGGRDLPGFILAGVRSYTVVDENDRTRYEVRFVVGNDEPADGAVVVTFTARGRGRGFFGPPGGGDEESVERTIFLEGGQAREVGFVLDFQPRRMTVNTLVSKNLPAAMIRNFDDFEEGSGGIFDGERVLDAMPALAEPGEIVVDDLDPGFSITGERSAGLLRRLLRRGRGEEENEYEGIGFGAPEVWKKGINTTFYGRHVLSAHFVRAGDGSNRASWTGTIEKSGVHGVWAWVGSVESPFGRGRRANRTQAGSYSYLVHHDDGIDEVSLDAQKAEEGWNFLGSWYLSAGEARVELTDETDGGRVFADAVKWVRQ